MFEERAIRRSADARRLQARARRVESVVAALREREQARARDGAVPRPLQQAIAGFGHELGAMTEALRRLERSA